MCQRKILKRLKRKKIKKKRTTSLPKMKKIGSFLSSALSASADGSCPLVWVATCQKNILEIARATFKSNKPELRTQRAG
jgi:hypothetical protein